MKRYSFQRERIQREHRLHLRYLHNWPKEAIACPCELQAGRFRKKKALGCGRARCLLCHCEKIFGIPSHRDRIRRMRADDASADYLEMQYEAVCQTRAESAPD
jgi:hypothetical protein